ncbi:hypothetical protein Q5H93_07755 [Hymenobacter sp. ASUV-10]|uniref:Uncharacterized protein n=1 Tax=Hymenobacter aranciens TaxID=3063996 RepID=A0ABT9B8U0_9BACT|nr:hypothetical protein [Hymenobacter sp. ASUV-10]MDO7874623.1 hypothetical protein [Hymenobacter sp. ASUV-10]
MDNEKENQYAMTTVLAKFITDNRPAIKASKVADADAGDVLTAYEAVKNAVGQAPLSTRENTKKAKDSRRELLKLLPVVLGPLRSIATKTNDPDLLARATLNSRQFYKMKPEELRDVSKALLEAAANYQKELADYALTPEALATLNTKHGEFAGTVRRTSSLIDTRSTANQTTDDLLDELMQQVYELDKPMDVFRLLNKELYTGYKKARRVGSMGGGKGGEEPKPQV